MFDGIRAGAALEKVGRHGPRQVRCMVWCLAEAVRCMNRAVLRDAAATLMQYVRAGGARIRFRASGQLIDETVGNIGLFEAGGTGEELAITTMQALQLFCTPNLGRPTPGTEGVRRSETQCGTVLLDEIVRNICIFYADVAGDEQVAAEALMEKGDDGALLPSLGLAGRDKVPRCGTSIAPTTHSGPLSGGDIQPYGPGSRQHSKLDTERPLPPVFGKWLASNIVKSSSPFLPSMELADRLGSVGTATTATTHHPRA